MNWNSEFYHNAFSHIYVDEKAGSYPAARRLIARFPQAQVIPIGHYMDVFSPCRQEFRFQKRSRKLILAVKPEPLVYEGAPVCQDFGNRHFYYTSCVMNCIYDCEYCFLQGTYPGANLVVFVNLPDFFTRIEELLSRHPVYLCISYDTDLLALEGLTGFAGQFADFTARHRDLTVECRTKSASFSLLAGRQISQRFILAWTLSPERVARSFEHGAPSLSARLSSLREALNAGCRIRLCFDPVLRVPGWKQLYGELFQTVSEFFKTLPQDPVASGQLADVSAGTFRISREYLGRMRKNAPDSPLVQYPYRTTDGVSGYGPQPEQEMMEFVRAQLACLVPKERIYLWEGGKEKAT